MEGDELIILLNPAFEGEIGLLISWICESPKITEQDCKEKIDTAIKVYGLDACINTNLGKFITYCDVSFYKEEGCTIVPIRDIINRQIIPEYIKKEINYDNLENLGIDPYEF